MSVLIPLAFAFLDDPEAGDILEEANGVGDAEFIAEAIFEGFGGGEGFFDFDPHDGPGARGEP